MEHSTYNIDMEAYLFYARAINYDFIIKPDKTGVYCLQND